MKKGFKILGISFAIFALVANLYSAVFTFYGIKSSHLAGAVWAQSTSSSSSSSGAGIWTLVPASCTLSETIPVSVTTTTSGSAGVSASGTKEGVITISVTGSSSNSTSSINAQAVTYNASQSTCTGGDNWTCWSTNCYRKVGVNPTTLIYNGKVYSISTSGVTTSN